MEDRELLELAAKAVGGIYDPLTNCITSDGGIEFEQWEPLEDDGDALRLAVKINEVRMFIYPSEVSMGCLGIVEKYAGDPMPAARRAIVRAAAEIGKSMP